MLFTLFLSILYSSKEFRSLFDFSKSFDLLNHLLSCCSIFNEHCRLALSFVSVALADSLYIISLSPPLVNTFFEVFSRFFRFRHFAFYLLPFSPSFHYFALPFPSITRIMLSAGCFRVQSASFTAESYFIYLEKTVKKYIVEKEASSAEQQSRRHEIFPGLRRHEQVQ